MNGYRKYITSSVGFSFLIVGTTGVIFKFFFKTHVLENIHGWLGIFLVVAAIFHILQNWPSLRNHFRDRNVFALLIPILLLISFFVFSPPEPNQGVNPREVVRKLFHASIEGVSRAFRKDVNTAIASMIRDGIHIQSASETIEDVAHENQKSPEMILRYFMD